jgi:hypothetical protein
MVQQQNKEENQQKELFFTLSSIKEENINKQIRKFQQLRFKRDFYGFINK